MPEPGSSPLYSDPRWRPKPVEARVLIKSVAPAALAVIALLIPFLTKAFSVDDVTFLLQAKHVLTDPWHPTAFDMVFHGGRVRLSEQMVTGPVMAFLLLPSVLLDGAEWVAHLPQIGFLVLGATATASLGLRLGMQPVQAGLAAFLAVGAAPVLAMATTAMPDVPAMALGIAGIERFIAWRQSRRVSIGLCAALLLALSALARSHTVLLIPCVLLWLVLEQAWSDGPQGMLRKVIDQVALPLGGALLCVSAVTYATKDPQQGVDLAGAVVSRSGGTYLWVNLANFALQWTVAFPLGVLWPALRGPAFLRSRGTWLGMSLGIALAWVGQYGPLTVLVALSCAVLGDVLFDAWQHKDATQIFLGAWLLFAAVAAPYAHLPAKFLVPSAPAMGLLIAGHSMTRLTRYRWWVAACAALSLVLGVLIIRADAEMAEIGREGGRIVAEQIRQGNRVWADGAWGFQWYAMQAGAEPLAKTPPLPGPGDLIVASLAARLVEAEYGSRTLLYRRVYDAPGGRVFGEGAGFYSNTRGPMPWVWGKRELGRIEVWRLDPPEGEQPTDRDSR